MLPAFGRKRSVENSTTLGRGRIPMLPWGKYLEQKNALLAGRNHDFD
jgi:hypothetical protein